MCMNPLMLSPAYALLHSGVSGKTAAGAAIGGLSGAMLASSMGKKKRQTDTPPPPAASFGG